MKIKLSDILESYAALMGMTEKSFPATAAYKIYKSAKICEDEKNSIHEIAKKRAIELGAEVTDGKIMFPEGVDDSCYQNEMNELINNKEIDLGIEFLEVSDLGETVLSPKELYAIRWLIRE